MTITATPSEISYAGNGVTTVFPVPFPFDTAADLRVISTDADGNPVIITTGFSVSGGGGSTGAVTFTLAPSASVSITILDNPAQTQPTDYTDNDPFPAESHERALDRVTRIAKRLQQQIKRCLRTTDGDPSGESQMLLPSVQARASRLLGFDSNGRPEMVASVTDIGAISQSIIGALLSPQTSAEAAAGVTPTNYAPPVNVNVLRYGADPTGASDDTAAFRAAVQAANGTASAGAVSGGKVFVPKGTYNVSTCGIRGTVIVGESREGTIIRGIGSGSASQFMFNACLDLDHSTANTVGGGWCENMTLDDNGAGRSLLRTYGGGAHPRSLILRGANATGARGLSMGLPIWATVQNVYAVDCDTGFFTDSGAGDNGTSLTMTACWADQCGLHGFHITQLYYSSFINCVAQDCGVNNWFVQGDANGINAVYSLQFIGCATEGGGRPFLIEDARDVSIISPRVIQPDSGVDLVTLDNASGTIMDFSTPGALSGGAFHLAVANHAAGTGAIKVIGGDVTIDPADSTATDAVAFSGRRGGEGVRAVMGNHTCDLSDAGRTILHDDGAGSGHTITIPANSAVAYPVGTKLRFANRDGNAVSIAITTDAMILAGTFTTGTRSLATNGYAIAEKVKAGTWIIYNLGGLT
jgi:hypothetical protein